jgi:hypothetical protein
MTDRIAHLPQAPHTPLPYDSNPGAPPADLQLDELERWLELVDALAEKVGHVGSTDSEKWTFGRLTPHPANEAERP